ncbi:MAG: TIGR00730 family Rossman fold protein [Clostridia bacterium]|nr:TIGR00730 family Rossman fold protein [Clostridia bacterium]
MNITVYGAAKENIHEEFKIKTEELGRIMAQRGHTLIFGGGKNGLMGAVARGMSKEKGRIIGIAPKFFKPDGVLYEQCTEFIYTEDMRSRKALLEQKGDAIIVLPGGIGTYDEFFEVLTLNTLGRINKRIAIFNLRGYYDHLFSMLSHTAKEGFMEKSVVDGLKFTASPEELLDFLEK